MATLYLMESDNLEARRDGPSLWVGRRGGGGRRVPVRRVDRVVIGGKVRIDTDCITLFTESEIPILFLSAAGRPLGVALGANRRYTPLTLLLRDWLLTESGRSAYQAWLASWRRKVQLDVLTRLGPLVKVPFLPGGWKDEAFDLCLKGALPVWSWPGLYKTATRWVMGLLQEFLLAEILKAEFSPSVSTLDPGKHFGLMEDMRRIFRPEAAYQALLFCRRREERSLPLYYDAERGRLTPLGRRKMIGFFERQWREIEKGVSGFLGALIRLIREEGYDEQLSHRV